MSRWVPAIAAVVGTVGDLVLLAVVRDRIAGGSPALAWVVLGGTLGVLAIPLYAPGYRLVTPTLRRWDSLGGGVVGVLGVAIALVGASIHGLTAWHLAADMRAGAAPVGGFVAVASWGVPLMALWAVAVALATVASMLVVWGGVRLGIWPLVLTSPALVTVALATVGGWTELGRAYLVPAAPNIAHVVFFVVAAYASTRRLGRSTAKLNVTVATSDSQIESCYPVMVQLRPHVKPAEFVARVRAQETQGYRLAFVREAGRVIAVAGFRLRDSLAWGPVLHLDDLVTDETWRSRGVGHRLLEWVMTQAREAGCDEVHVDAGVQHLDAHRFFERERFRHVANHYRIRLDGAAES